MEFLKIIINIVLDILKKFWSDLKMLNLVWFCI